MVRELMVDSEERWQHCKSALGGDISRRSRWHGALPSPMHSNLHLSLVDLSRLNAQIP